MADRFQLHVNGTARGANDAVTLAPTWDGPTPPEGAPQIIARHGVYLNPLNPHDPQDQLRLRAYLWPDQPERMARTIAAIDCYDAQVDRGDAIDWLANQPDHQTGQLHLIYHTIAWQYFPADVQDHGRALIEAAGRKATDDAPLAWFGMEPDGDSPGAAMTLRIWPGDITVDIGRMDFHGRWINWKGWI